MTPEDRKEVEAIQKTIMLRGKGRYTRRYVIHNARIEGLCEIALRALNEIEQLEIDNLIVKSANLIINAEYKEFQRAERLAKLARAVGQVWKHDCDDIVHPECWAAIQTAYEELHPGDTKEKT